MSTGNIGQNPLAYLGVKATRPPNLVTNARAPTANDTDEDPGTFWFDKSSNILYQYLDAGSWVALTIAPSTVTVGATGGATLNALKGSTVHVGLTTAAAAVQGFTITNSFVTVNTAMLLSVVSVGAEDAQLTIQGHKVGAGNFNFIVRNNGAAALASNVIVSFEIISV